MICGNCNFMYIINVYISSDPCPDRQWRCLLIASKHTVVKTIACRDGANKNMKTRQRLIKHKRRLTHMCNRDEAIGIIRMGQVLNGCLYFMYGSSSVITTEKWDRMLTDNQPLLCYYKMPQEFCQPIRNLRKTNMQFLIFFLLLFFDHA